MGKRKRNEHHSDGSSGKRQRTENESFHRKHKKKNKSHSMDKPQKKDGNDSGMQKSTSCKNLSSPTRPEHCSTMGSPNSNTRDREEKVTHTCIQSGSSLKTLSNVKKRNKKLGSCMKHKKQEKNERVGKLGKKKQKQRPHEKKSPSAKVNVLKEAALGQTCAGNPQDDMSRTDLDVAQTNGKDPRLIGQNKEKSSRKAKPVITLPKTAAEASSNWKELQKVGTYSVIFNRNNKNMTKTEKCCSKGIG